MTPNKVEAELLCYKLIRKQGCVKHLICIGLFSVANCTNMTVRAWEIKMINQYQSKYNMPFLRQHLKDTAYIPERSRSDNTSYHVVGRHKNHAAFSTTNYELPNHKIVYWDRIADECSGTTTGRWQIQISKTLKTNSTATTQRSGTDKITMLTTTEWKKQDNSPLPSTTLQ